jgi:hypothetical protein
MAGGGSFVLCGALFSRRISGLEIEKGLSTLGRRGGARHAHSDAGQLSEVVIVHSSCLIAIDADSLTS